LLTYVGDRVVCRFKLNWFGWDGVLIGSHVGCDVWYLLWGILLIQVLYGNELIIGVEYLYVQLFIRKYERLCIDVFQ